MKKFLSVLAVLGIITAGVQSANAFSWSSLNPWSKCNKCKTQPAPCPTGYAAPCDPCEKKTPCNPCDKQISKPAPCDACDRLQQEMKDK